jgi:hypothetical protein
MRSPMARCSSSTSVTSPRSWKPCETGRSCNLDGRPDRDTHTPAAA